MLTIISPTHAVSPTINDNTDDVMLCHDEICRYAIILTLLINMIIVAADYSRRAAADTHCLR